jgi:four helix bundle protein
MATIKVFEDTEVWQFARKLSKDIFDLTNIGPLPKDYGFRDQINRASVSIMKSIAEGFERPLQKSLFNYFAIAKGSAVEVPSQLYTAAGRNHLERRTKMLS